MIANESGFADRVVKTKTEGENEHSATWYGQEELNSKVSTFLGWCTRMYTNVDHTVYNLTGPWLKKPLAFTHLGSDAGGDRKGVYYPCAQESVRRQWRPRKPKDTTLGHFIGDGIEIKPRAVRAPKGERVAKIRGRETKKPKLLAAGMDDAMQKLEGNMDAMVERKVEEEVKAQLEAEPEPVRLVYTVNRFSLTYGSKKFDSVVDPDGTVYIVGRFEMNDGGTVALHERLNFYSGGPIVGHSKCYTLIQVPADNAVAHVVPGQGAKHIDGDISTRLLMSAMAVLRHVDFRSKNDVNAISLRIKSHYLTYYRSFPALDGQITELVRSAWFSTQYTLALNETADSWERNLKNRISHKAAEFGMTYEMLVAERKKKAIRKMALKFGLASGFHLILGSMLPPLGVMVGFFFSLLPLGIDVYQYCMLFHNPFEGERLLLTTLSAEMFPNHNPGIMPCYGGLEIKTSVKPVEAFPTELAADVVIESKYEPVDDVNANVKCVDIFGASIGRPITYPARHAQNVEAAVRIRMGKPRDVDPKMLKSLRDFGRKYIDSLPRFEVFVTDDQRLKFLTSQYGTVRGNHLFTMFSKTLDAKDLVYKMFCKGEGYCGKGEENFKPRMIFCCPDIVISIFGAEFALLGQLLSDLWNKSTKTFYVCGARPADLGAYAEIMDEECSSKAESDVSNWDGSLDQVMLKLELYFLRTKVKGFDDRISVLYENWTKIKGVTSDYSLTVSMEHGRRSGDLWTSMFNSLLNIIITSWAYEKEVEDLRIMVLGDDNVVGCKEPLDVVKATARYASVGMSCTIVARDTMAEATFCSGRFWKVDGRYIWGNFPFRTLSKLGMNHHGHSKRKFRGLLYGSCLSLMSTAGHVPVIGTFIRAIADSCEAGKVREIHTPGDWSGRISGGLAVYPTKDTYAQFCELYAITLDEVFMIEEWIENNVTIEDCPYLFTGKAFLDGFDVDTDIDHDFVPDLSLVLDNDKLNNAIGGLLATEKRDGRIKFSYKDPSLSEDAVVYNHIVNVVPMQEEIEKLSGCDNVFEALGNAYRFGEQENKDFGCENHHILHMLFTSFSYLNLRWGVGLHSAYNAFALQTNVRNSGFILPCKKRRKKKGGGFIGPKEKSVSNFDMKALKASLKGMVKHALTEGGAALGGVVGGAPGSYIGGKAGALLSKIIGSGDYRIVNGPAVRNNTLTSSGASFKNDARRVSIAHHEFIGDVKGFHDFTVQSFAINPGLSGTFPWLSQLAGPFQQWKLRGCVFTYKPTSAEWSGAGQALGTVMMGTQYNVHRGSFLSKIEMENYEFTSSCKPSEGMMHPIECDPRETPINEMYIRNGEIDEKVEDRKWFDWGNFQLATVGLDASVSGETIGELWVAYDIEFMKPQIQPGGVLPGQFALQANRSCVPENPLGVIEGPKIGNLKFLNFANSLSFTTVTTGARIAIMITFKRTASAETGFLTPSFTACELDTDPSWFFSEIGVRSSYFATEPGVDTDSSFINIVIRSTGDVPGVFVSNPWDTGVWDTTICCFAIPVTNSF